MRPEKVRDTVIDGGEERHVRSSAMSIRDYVLNPGVIRTLNRSIRKALDRRQRTKAAPARIVVVDDGRGTIPSCAPGLGPAAAPTTAEVDSMGYDWIHENPPHWDDSKAALVGRAPEGIFDFASQTVGDLISGEWWRVEEDGETVGYGWMDCTWGDAEILLAVDPVRRKRGAGAFILDRLEAEAANRGLNYMFNVVPEKHPDRQGIARWLTSHGFEPSHDRLRRRVRSSDG